MTHYTPKQVKSILLQYGSFRGKAYYRGVVGILRLYSQQVSFYNTAEFNRYMSAHNPVYFVRLE